jgi:hypothetical protein
MRITQAPAVLLGLAAFMAGGARAEDAPLERMTDKDGLVALQLPKGSKIRPDWGVGDAAAVGAWDVELDTTNDKPELNVYVFVRRGAVRAELVGSTGRGCRWGTPDPESVVVKDGEWRDRRAETEKSLLYCQRVVAAKGQVFFVVAQVNALAYDALKERIDRVLDGFEVLQAAKPIPLPASYKQIGGKGREVWTDGKKGDVDRIVREWNSAIDLWSAVLPGEPASKAAPMLIVCANDADYDALWGKSTTGSAPPLATHHSSMRAVMVRLSQRKDEDQILAIHRAAGSQMVEGFFGGDCPLWLEAGLRMYLSEGVYGNGHFDHPRGGSIEKAKSSALERKVTFADVVAMTEIPRGSRTSIDMELWSWHYFFRLGGGAKPYGDRYRQYLETLRKSGDVREADKAWDGLDQARLRSDYLAWIEKWR